jgi:hypothetical protein
MTTRSWFGGIGDWYDELLWSSAAGASGYPGPGDVAFVNNGTVVVSGSQETSSGVPVDGIMILIGATSALDPAVIETSDARFGKTTTLISTGYAALDLTGPTGFAGTILADSGGSTFSIDATAQNCPQQAAFVLLHGGFIDVTAGDDLVLTGSMVADSSVTIAGGSTFTNDGTLRAFGGTTFIAPTATLAGTGTFEAGPGATLALESAVPATQTVVFDQAGRLDLSSPSSFAGTISAFSQGDTIDLLGIVATSASFDAASDLLTIMNGTSVVAALAMQGPQSDAVLNAGTDGSGGTLITYPGSASRTSYEIDTGDQALQADTVRSTMTTAAGAPIIGTGITIGIMSDSFNATVNGDVDPADAAAQAGYLPETAQGTSAVTIVQDSTANGVENEGLAMAELVHQIAPGASIEFYTAEGGQTSFAQGVTALVQHGANIIVDDWSFSNTPFYQVAGPVDTAVQNAVSAGVDYFTAASNFGDSFYESAWDPVGASLVLNADQPAQDVTAQDFSNGTPLQAIAVPGSIAASIDLQWDAPWPAEGASVPDPIAMVLYSATTGSIVATSNQVANIGGGFLPEINLSVPVASTSTQYDLAIYQKGTDAVSQFKYVLFGSPGTVTVSSTTPYDGSTVSAQDPGGIIDDPLAGQGSGDVHGQELVPDVNTVGATYWSGAPAFGVPSDWTEYFSSVGPGQLLYDQNGDPLATPESAGKIDFVAPDGVQTSVSGFQPFFGTSAASPQAAAVAALMLQADPSLTTSQVTDLLEQSAINMNLPAADQGAGLIQATTAVQLALAASKTTAGLSVLDTTTDQALSAIAQPYSGRIEGPTSEYISATTDNLNIAASTPNWFIRTGSGDDSIRVSSGTNVLEASTGSNFLSGGTGTDTFVIDARDQNADTWNTIANFHFGDAAIIWGVTPADFRLTWVDGQGAAGYTGLTLHAAGSHVPTASLTLAGFTIADLTNGSLNIGFGTTSTRGAYLDIKAT